MIVQMQDPWIQIMSAEWTMKSFAIGDIEVTSCHGSERPELAPGVRFPQHAAIPIPSPRGIHP